MCKSKFLKGLSLIFGLTSSMIVQAGFTEIEFSAEMRQSGPQGSSTGNMYVGKERMRMEMEQGGGLL